MRWTRLLAALFAGFIWLVCLTPAETLAQASPREPQDKVEPDVAALRAQLDALPTTAAEKMFVTYCNG